LYFLYFLILSNSKIFCAVAIFLDLIFYIDICLLFSIGVSGGWLGPEELSPRPSSWNTSTRAIESKGAKRRKRENGKPDEKDYKRDRCNGGRKGQTKD